jgi:NRPS condensation-like uncharacterized protein
MKNRKAIQWNRLDNAAKIFPPTSGKRDTKVFRFACQLKEEIEEEILQEALNRTTEVFPIFRSVIKKGLFWYYLEASRKNPMVREEDTRPCSPLYDRNSKKLLFDVTYYKNRINLEVYHALTDGTGALHFLKTMLYHYLMLKHADELSGKKVLLDYDASATQRLDDSFSRYYDNSQKTTNNKKVAKKVKIAYKLKGSRVSEYRLKIIKGTVSVKEVLNKAHEFNTTMTVFLVSLIMCSIGEEMTVREKRRPVVITVPVNLRNFFESESARNFFGVITVEYDFKNNSDELEDVIEKISDCFQRELTKEQLSKRMHKLGALEHNFLARATPLFLKDIIMKIAYRVSSLNYTFSVSNVGRVMISEELNKYIEQFDVFVSTNKQQMCMCSYGDNLNMSFTSSFISTEIQKRFIRKLSGMGMSVEVATNQGWEE